MRLFITPLDFLILPFVLFGIYYLAYRIREKYYPAGHPWRRYFIRGLSVKIIGAIFISLIYQFYYGNGDTANYFRQALSLNEALWESPIKWFKLLLHIPKWYDGDYQQYISQIFWYSSKSNFAVISSTAFISIFTFNTYLPTAVIFAFISYSGIWAMFRAFAQLFPNLLHAVALATLFIPSTYIWGSGIFKDTLCMLGLGWMIYSVYKIIMRKDFSAYAIFAFVMSFILIFNVKKYILLAFLPALTLWVISIHGDKVKIPFFKPFLFLVSIGAFVVSLTFFSSAFAEELGNYSLESVAETSQNTREYISRTTKEGGSTYDLGEFEPTPAGIIRKIPAGIVVTLFRPFPWEAKKVISLLNGLESLLFLLLTVKIVLSVGFAGIYRAFMNNGTIQFCLVFALIFSFAIGISTYNFGSLSRYRIPALPLYGMALVLLYYSKNPPTKKLLSFRI